MRADGYVEVLEGIRAGEKVVVSANFLIDAESNLKAALGSLAAMSWRCFQSRYRTGRARHYGAPAKGAACGSDHGGH